MGLSQLDGDVPRCSFPNCVIQRNRGEKNTRKEMHMINTKFPISDDDTMQIIQLHC